MPAPSQLPEGAVGDCERAVPERNAEVLNATAAPLNCRINGRVICELKTAPLPFRWPYFKRRSHHGQGATALVDLPAPLGSLPFATAVRVTSMFLQPTSKIETQPCRCPCCVAPEVAPGPLIVNSC
jgi:hypothetical protein